MNDCEKSEKNFKFVIVKYPGKNIMLEVLGEYPTPEEEEIIEKGGFKLSVKSDTKLKSYWTGDVLHIPKPCKIEPSTQLAVYVAPRGSDVFGLHTQDEEKHIMKLFEAFIKAKIPIYFRNGDLKELI